MLKLKALEELGKPYKIFTDYVESSAIEQFVAVMQQPDVKQGALMPDVHAGYVLPIGGVVATEWTIYPAFVGYDIGCGVCTVPIDLNAALLAGDPAKYRKIVEDAVPVGFTVHEQPFDLAELERHIGRAPDSIRDIAESHLNQVGTLGGGNHFVELGVSEKTGKVHISIHSGSRGMGARVAEKYMKLSGGEGIHPIDTREPLGREYLAAMNYCLRWALFNRKMMVKNIMNGLGLEFNTYRTPDIFINRNHNHAEFKDGLWIHRKGATHAEDGMLGVIPANMRDGVFIVRGRGNPDSLCSSSHGAGRVMSRSKAKKTFSLDDFQEQMGAINPDGFTVDEKRIDEAPSVYKDINEVMKNQTDLIDVIDHVKPLVNVKG